MATIEKQVEKEDTADLLESAIGDVKETLSNLRPSMQLADQSTIMRAIRDKCFNVLLPRSDELDQLLEEIIPNVDIPNAPDIIQAAQQGGDMSEVDQKVVPEIFESWNSPRLNSNCVRITRMTIKNNETGPTDDNYQCQH